tara:strand:- start:484 stop:1182 length:699 start_codon:yes stop_codon:yes gene_type:complete
MSRLRKGNKYKGGCFADQFKSAMTMKSPLYQSEVVAEKVTQPAVAGQTPTEELETSPVEGAKLQLEESSAAGATVQNFGPDDIPPKIGSNSRNQARKDWNERNKQKAIDAVEEAKQLKAEEEAAAAEAERSNYRDEDDNIVFQDDYEAGMSGKERRKESRQNKKGIKADRKSDKADIKARRKGGEISRKEARALKKKGAAEKKGLKKSNKTLKKKNRKGSKCTKRMKKKGQC